MVTSSSGSSHHSNSSRGTATPTSSFPTHNLVPGPDDSDILDEFDDEEEEVESQTDELALELEMDAEVEVEAQTKQEEDEMDLLSASLQARKGATRINGEYRHNSE